MSDLGSWLRQIGLDQYTGVLSEHDVDLGVVPALTDDDLKELGLSLGHRRKLLAHALALARSGGAAGTPLPSSGIGAMPDHTAPASGPERRQLTVMFADLVDSTRLSQQLDPEDLREILRAYRVAATTAIEGFGGYVARYSGDGILVYFGYPEAHEDDAECGVRAALALVDAVAALRPTLSVSVVPRVAVRVGIATGPVVVGDEIGEGASQERSAVGETPNLAARLQGLAEPNTVVLSPITRRLVTGSVACSNLGKHRLKGIAQPVEVWCAEKVLGKATRFEKIAHNGPLTPLIGRQSELQMLVGLWERVASGQAQVVLVSGEPGIGKSRLVETLREHVGGSSDTEFVFQCSPLRRNSALYPVASRIRMAASIEDTDDPASALGRLECFLARLGKPTLEELALFADLLSIPSSERYPALDLSPSQRRYRTLSLLVSLLRVTTGSTPVLLVFEDLQWIDPTSLELLELLISGVQDARAMVVITYRPPLEIPWAGLSHVTQLSLSNLSAEQTIEMVNHLSGNGTLPQRLVGDIAQRSDGVPLFIEEHTRALLDDDTRSRHAVEDGDREVAPSQEIPVALRDLLAARLDQLSSAKEVAQQAAVVGREFSFRELHDLTAAPEDALRTALEQLVAAQIIVDKSEGRDKRFSFKHSLVRDAAYQSLLKSTRRELHLRHAQALELRRSATSPFAPEVVAQHYLAARAWHDAIRCLQVATTEALAKSANKEALHHVDAGLEAVERLEESGLRNEIELDLVSQKGAALRALEGYATPRVEQVYRKARRLLAGGVESPRRFQLEWQQMQYFLVNGDLATAAELAQSLLALARQRDDSELALDAYLANGMVAFHRGEPQRARVYFEQGLAYHRPDCGSPRALTHGQDAGVFCLSYLGYTLWFLGEVASSQARVSEALEIAEQRQHAFSRVSALTFATRVAQCRREVSMVEPLAESLIALAHRKGFNYYAAIGVLQRGWTRVWRGDDTGMREMMEGYRALEKTGTVLGLSAALLQIADASLRQGDLERASWALEKAESKEAGRGTRCWDSELARARAEFTEQRGAPADELFQKALAVAREQSAHSLELRAALSYARALSARGKLHEAVSALGPSMGLFANAEDGVEAREARTLLKPFATDLAG